jgi:hypothetical protein
MRACCSDQLDSRRYRPLNMAPIHSWRGLALIVIRDRYARRLLGGNGLLFQLFVEAFQ